MSGTAARPVQNCIMRPTKKSAVAATEQGHIVTAASTNRGLHNQCNGFASARRGVDPTPGADSVNWLYMFGHNYASRLG